MPTPEKKWPKRAPRGAAGDGELALTAECGTQLGVDEAVEHRVSQAQHYADRTGFTGRVVLDGGGRRGVENLALPPSWAF